MTWTRKSRPSGGGAAAMKPDRKEKPAAWKKGWSRALSIESDRPITLHKAPWETETEKDSDERHSAPRG